MTFYSREIKMPQTRKEGFCNFVQIIINQLERGGHQEALLAAVDLLDTISGNANPYASVMAEKDNALVAELNRKHNAEMVEAISRAAKDGFERGVAAEKDRMAKVLGLAA